MKREIISNYGYMVIIAALVLAGLILLNVIAGILSDRYNVRLDLTGEKLYTLSDASREILENMQHNVDLYIIGTEKEWQNGEYRSVQDLLRSYVSSSGGRVMTEYLSASEAAARFVEEIDLMPNDIVVRGPYRHTKMNAADFYTETDGVRYFHAETQISSGLDYVLRSTVGKAYFIRSHSETNSRITNLKTQMEQSGYICDLLDLKENEVPDDAELLISMAPRMDYSSEETEKLSGYMETGGVFLLFYSHEGSEKPVLDSFLEDWGMSVGRYTLMREGELPADRVDLVPIVPNEEEYPRLAEYAAGDNRPVLISGYSISKLEGADDRQLTSLLITTDASYAQHIDSDVRLEDPETYSAMMLSEQRYRDDVTARLVLTSYSMADDMLGMAEDVAEQNGGYLMAMIQEFVPVELPEDIPPKRLGKSPVEVGPVPSGIIFTLFVILIPLMTLLPALRASAKRRTKS